jgi:hypothetical protein
MFQRQSFWSNDVNILQTTLATEAHLAEGQILLTEQTLNIGKSRIYRTGTQRTTISKAEEQSIEPRQT